MASHAAQFRRARVACKQQGIILLAVLVFLLMTSLLSLGDMRAALTHQRMVASEFDAANEFTYTESALNIVETYAIRELKSIQSSSTYKGGNIRNPNDLWGVNICTGTVDSDQACTVTTCDSNTYAGLYQQILPSASKCSYCMRPSPVCKPRVYEANRSGRPWSQITVQFTPRDKDGNAPNGQSSAVFYNFMEYLGKAPCNFSAPSPVVTNLGTYGGQLCLGTQTGSYFPQCGTSTTNTCPVMRVTVSNSPVDPLRASVTLQSTVIVADPSNPTLYPDRRISFRQVLPR